jgi:hypothetical protein
MISHKIFLRSIEFLSAEQDLRIVFNALEGNYALCLLGNLIHMAHIERDDSLREIYYPAFTVSNYHLVSMTCRAVWRCVLHVCLWTRSWLVRIYICLCSEYGVKTILAVQQL